MIRTYGDIFGEVLSRITATRAEVWASAYDVVDEEGIFRLLRYRPVIETKYRTPVLMVYAFINRPYVLDLQPEVSVVQKFLRAGFEVYMIDWGYPGPVDRFLTLDDYADYLDKAVRQITRTGGVDKLNLHGYCLGGTISAAYAAIRQQRIENLILQTTPIDFHTDNLIARWARALDPNTIADAYRMAPGAFLNIGFLMVDPVNLIIGKYGGLLEMIESERDMSNFLCMDRWVFDSPAIPGETFRQYIKEWYHDNSLMNGGFRMLGEKVELSRISGPVLVLAAQHDHIVPPESQKAIIDLISSRDREIFEMPKGHVGITTSRESHKEYWPRAVKWLEERSEPKHPRVREPVSSRSEG